MIEYQFSKRIEPITGSAIRAIFKMLADPQIVSLAGGNPSMTAFPSEDIARIANELLTENGANILQYSNSDGWPALKRTLQKELKKKGIEAADNEIVTLSGSSQGIELATKTLLDEGDVVLVENPTFLGAIQTFRTYRANPIGVEMDDDGVILEDLERKMAQHKPKLVYLIPNFQNPSGRTMSLERRKGALALARKYKVRVLEDDPYGCLRYEGEHLPSLKSLDNDVIFLESFSKTISPGLRLGYAVADAPLVNKMVIARQGMDIHASNLSQAIVDRYISEGLLEGHIADLCAEYKEKRDIMLEEIQRTFPQSVKVTRPEGGLFIWVELPEGADGEDLFKKAVERKVAFVPGAPFFADGTGQNTFRLNFSMPNHEQIRHAVGVLGQLLQEEL